MRTLMQLSDYIRSEGRMWDEVTRAELLELLEIVVDDINNNRTKVLHAWALMGARDSLMTQRERSTEAAELAQEIRQWTREIGAKGGASKTPAKSAASRANGRKGGRPNKNNEPKKQE